MKSVFRWVAVAFLLSACGTDTDAYDAWAEAMENAEPAEVAVVRAALGTDWYPTLTDSLVVDGVCSLREAVRACYTRAAVDTCAAGHATDLNTIHLVAGTFSASIAGSDNTALAGDLDVGCNLAVVGASMATTILDMNSIDRAFHISGALIFELSNLTIREGCTNGGTCIVAASGSIATGGGFYHNSSGRLRVTNVRIESSAAAQGGGFGICAATSPDAIVDGAEIYGNTATQGGGGIDAHVVWTLRNSIVENNTVANTSNWGTGGGLRQWDRTLTIENTIIRNNSSIGAGGGIAAVGASSAAVAGIVWMVGGELTNNQANTNGGNVFVNAGAGGANLYSVPCSSAGCVVTLEGVAVTSGDADSPATAPAGSGGNLAANASSSAPGRIDLRGTTAVSGGTDPSSPVAVDCEGAVSLYNTSSVAITTGCTITDNRGPVCGNSIVEAGENCDGPVCCAACIFSVATTSCNDGNACTVGDACNGAGSCVAGTGNTCGNGVVACGEACDDGATLSGDGCSATCTAESCIAWQ